MNVMCMSTYLNRIVIRDPFENEVLERESESEKNIAYFRPVFVRKTSLNVKTENANTYSCQLKSLIPEGNDIFFKPDFTIFNIINAVWDSGEPTQKSVYYTTQG